MKCIIILLATHAAQSYRFVVMVVVVIRRGVTGCHRQMASGLHPLVRSLLRVHRAFIG